MGILQLKYLLIENWTHFSTENSPPSGFSPASPAGRSKRRGGRLSTGRLSVGGRPSPWPPWGLEPSPSGLRPILLMPAPRIDHNRRIRGPIALIDQDPLLSPKQEKEKVVIVLFKWSKQFQLMCRIKNLRKLEGSIYQILQKHQQFRGRNFAQGWVILHYKWINSLRHDHSLYPTQIETCAHQLSRPVTLLLELPPT